MLLRPRRVPEQLNSVAVRYRHALAQPRAERMAPRAERVAPPRAAPVATAQARMLASISPTGRPGADLGQSGRPANDTPPRAANPCRRDAAAARVEALLFVATEPVSSRKIAEIANLADGTEARTLIRQLNRFYDLQPSAFRVEEVAGGFQLLTRPKFGGWLRRLHPLPVESRLSAPALETLAVVAYRQPVVRAEIESIRGVQCGEILRQLIERELVRIVGRSDELGRPFLYGTTKAFMRAFGLRSLAELPRAEQLGRDRNNRAVAEESRENMPDAPRRQLTPSNDLNEEPEVTIAAISESAREDLWQVDAARWAIERAQAKDVESEDVEDEDLDDDDDDDDEDLDEDDDLDDDDIEDEEWEEVDDEDDDDWEDEDEDDDDWEDDDDEDEDDDWEDE
jgi:segregation and condensation protein B